MKTLIALSLCAASACAVSQPARLLKVDAKVGATYRYHLTTDMSSPDGKSTMGFVATYTEKLFSKKANEFVWDSEFKVPSTYATGEAKGQDGNFKQLDNVKMRLISDAQGQTKRVEMGGIVVPSSGTPNVTFSKKPVKVGDRWMAVVDVQSQKIKIEYRLAKYMTQGKRNVAVIEGWYQDAPMIKQTTPVTFWVDVKDGKMVRASADLAFATAGRTLRMKYLLTLKS